MKASDALKQVGLRQLKHKHYISKMEKLGNPATTFMDAIDAGIHPTNMQDAYDLQHADARVSKLVSSISYFNICSSFMEWITANLEQPDSFLDLGCANGLFSLAISQIWKDAAGVGIDMNEQAIRVSMKLQASVEGGDAIEFCHADLTEPISEDLKQQIGSPNIVLPVSSFMSSCTTKLR